MELISVNIKNESGKLLVSSRDIAEGLDKAHYDVLKKTREILGAGEFSCSSYVTEQGKEMTEYLLDKNAFILLVMNYTGYNDFKRAYIKRFDEMEKALKDTTPKSFKEALYLAYKQQEQIELIEKQRDEAIRTKAWINDKKTAKAMNTASQKTKEVKRLEIELDKSKEFASTKLILIKTGREYNWRGLKTYCMLNELEIKKARDENYGEVNSYPAEAWKNIYNLDIKQVL